MIAELADGRELEFPDGTDPAVVQATVKKVLGMAAAAAPQTREEVIKGMPAKEFYAGMPLGRLAIGAASPLLAAGQMLGGEKTRAAISELQAAKEHGMAKLAKPGESSTDWLGYLGAMAPGAGIAAGVSKVLPAATGLAGQIGLGAAQGAGIAAATPVTGEGDFWTNKGLQTGAGALLGGIIPAAVEGVKRAGGLIGRVAEPMYERGRDVILKRFREALLSNDPALKAAAIQRLESPQTLVPGSQPTAGEALAGMPEATGLAAHQKAVSKMEGISPAYTARSTEQEAARRAAIGGIAQTPGMLEKAIEKRTAEAAEKYGTAGKVLVKADETFNDLLQRPSMKHILGRARDLAKEQNQRFQIGADVPEHIEASTILSKSGQPITKVVAATQAEYPVQSLHYMKMAMDDLIKNPERFGIGASEGRAILGTQKEFLKWLGEKAPAYSEARTAFAAASKPINRMQVGQELQKALIAPLGTTERAAGFATAMREAPRTMKKATGQPRYSELGEVLTPTETKATEAVAAELSRKDAMNRLAAKTTVQAGNVIPSDVGVPIPTLLSRPAMLANFVMRQFGKSAEQKIAEKAGQQYLNPQALANALKDLPTPQRQAVIEAIMRRAGIPLTVGAARQF